MNRLYLAAAAVVLFCSTALAFNLDFGFRFGGKSGIRVVDLAPIPALSCANSGAFGNQSTTTTRTTVCTFSVGGTDGIEAAVLTVGNTSGTSFSEQSRTCAANPFDLALLGSCTVTVAFIPPTATEFTGFVRYSAPNIPPVDVALTGTGVSSGILNLEFEPGETYAGWSTAGSTAPITDSTVNVLRGTRSLRMTDTGTDSLFTSPSFSDQSTIHAAFMVSATDSNTVSTAAVFRFLNGSTVISSLNILNGEMKFTHGSQVSPGVAMSNNTTYYVWLDYTAGTGTNGVGTWYVSSTGTKPGSPSHTFANGTGTLPINGISFLGRHSTNPNSYDFDHVLVSSDVIGDR